MYTFEIINICYAIVLSISLTFIGIFIAKKECSRYVFDKKNKLIAFVISFILGAVLGYFCRYADFLVIPASIVGTFAILIPSLMIDFQICELPDSLTFLSGCFAFIPFLAVPDMLNKENITWIIGGFILFFILGVIGVMGGGDIKLTVPLIMIVEITHASRVLTAFMYALIITIGLATFLIIRNKIQKKDFSELVVNVDMNNENISDELKMVAGESKSKTLIAFGPGMILGAFLTILQYLISF